MSKTLNEDLATEVIRERIEHHAAVAPRRTRTARALRRLADRIDKGT